MTGWHQHSAKSLAVIALALALGLGSSLLIALQPTTAAHASPPSTVPRVNVHPTAGAVGSNWATAPIFWFGRATENENYVDVRVAYDSQALYVYATIVDYYLWYDTTGSTDPRQYDALALFLDTMDDRAATPQSDDYLLVSGFRGWPTSNDTRWHRQARGTGSGWDYSWSPVSAWNDNIGLRYYNSGPNNNSDRDAGWTTTFTIPWASLGLAGPPASGQNWGLGMLLYDRDDAPPAAMISPESWPGALTEGTPSSWGILAFDPPPYTKPSIPPTGTTVVRQGLNGALVQDAYVGGGGTCGGGIYGGGDVAHPTDNLFVQNEADVSDFPCFSKSYLKFDLSGLPSGKAIISATLTVYGFGGSDPSQAQPSDVQLFTVADDWDQTTLTWNNAPMAHENVSATRVDVINNFPGWPGVPNIWDATQAVAEAYAAARPVNVALYSADTAYNSGKYFVSSDTGDWNAAGRPTLTISWGNQQPWSVHLPSIVKGATAQ